MSQTVLILMDYINEIVHENGKFAGKGYPDFVKHHNVLANVNVSIAKARKKQIKIVFVRIGFSCDYKEWPAASPLFGGAKGFGALKLGTWATELHDSIDNTDNDFLITKHRVNAFYATTLDAILRNLKADTLLLGGVATDLVVQSTAFDAHDRGYKVVVLEDLCGAANQDDHDAAINTLAKVAVVTKSDIVPQLN